MAFTKTRIWRGGIAGAPPAAPEPEPEPSDADEADLERAAERVSNMLPGFQTGAPNPLSATRFMPIEQLFPEQHQPAKRAALLTPVALPAWGARVRGWFRSRTTARTEASSRPAPRRALVVSSLLVALALIVAFVPAVRKRLISLSRAGEAAPLEPESSPVARDPAGATASAHSAARPEQRGATPVAKTPGEARSPANLQRSAIDALVSGDLARAADLYQRLTDSAPDQPVYREALRILRERSAAR